MALADIVFSGIISATTSGDSITANSQDGLGHGPKLDFSIYHTLAIWVQLKTLTGGSSPTCQVIIDGGDGQATPYWAHLNGDAPTWTSAPNQYRTSAGPGTSHNDSLASNGRIIWNINGSPSGCSFFVHIEGKR